jgi:hypothetical protein
MGIGASAASRTLPLLSGCEVSCSRCCSAAVCSSSHTAHSVPRSALSTTHSALKRLATVGTASCLHTHSACMLGACAAMAGPLLLCRISRQLLLHGLGPHGHPSFARSQAILLMRCWSWAAAASTAVSPAECNPVAGLEVVIKPSAAWLFCSYLDQHQRLGPEVRRCNCQGHQGAPT